MVDHLGHPVFLIACWLCGGLQQQFGCCAHEFRGPHQDNIYDWPCKTHPERGLVEHCPPVAKEILVSQAQPRTGSSKKHFLVYKDIMSNFLLSSDSSIGRAKL